MSPRTMKTLAIVFAGSVVALLTFGIVMLASTSSFYAFQSRGGDAFFYTKRQLLFLVMGLVACAVTASVDYRRYRKWAWPLLFVAAGLLAGVLVLGTPINGARRWYFLGPLRFQPSEFAKYALVLGLAWWLELTQRTAKGRLGPRIKHWWWGVFAPLAITGVLGFLILKEPDFGTTVLLGVVALVLMWIAGAPSGWLAAIVGSGALVIIAGLVAIFEFGMFHDHYQVQRLIHWWLEDDRQGINYQQWMAMLALGTGGTTGVGLGNSLMKLGFLPEAHTDFIFPIIGEELGLAVTLAVVVVFCVVVVCGILLAREAPDLFGRLLGAGIITVIGLQAIINMAVATNSIPNKGMALPFISYGGSNLLMSLAAVGILWNIFRQGIAGAENVRSGSALASSSQG